MTETVSERLNRLETKIRQLASNTCDWDIVVGDVMKEVDRVKYDVDTLESGGFPRLGPADFR